MKHLMLASAAAWLGLSGLLVPIAIETGAMTAVLNITVINVICLLAIVVLTKP